MKSLYSRLYNKSLLVKYGREISVGEIHPSLKFTKLGSHLREAAKDNDSTAHLAAAVLTNADHEGNPRLDQPLELTPLHALRDEMLEHSTHPLAIEFNWSKLPEKIALDEHIRPLDENHVYSAEFPTFLTRLYRSEPEAAKVKKQVSDTVGHPISREELFDSANRVNSQKYRELVAKQHRSSRSAGWEDAEEAQHGKAYNSEDVHETFRY